MDTLTPQMVDPTPWNYSSRSKPWRERPPPVSSAIVKRCVENPIIIPVQTVLNFVTGK